MVLIQELSMRTPLIALALLAAAPALAAPGLVSSYPAANTAVKPPGKISIGFNAPLKPGSAGAEIVMTAMPGMTDHPPMVIKAFTNELADDGKTLVLKLKNPLPVGSYTLNFAVTGMDGEPVNGSIDFRVE
jgi:methionine-rich copper-binding protein CopC